jgi:hypothetical protein
MYLKCAHPECSCDFDYGQGRLFRFLRNPRQDQQPSHWHSVKHFWLCTRCCESYTIEYQQGLGVLLMQRLETLAGGLPSHYVLQPEVAPKRAPEPIVTSRLPLRRARSSLRQRSRSSEHASAASSTIEVLENRNTERRG